MRRNDRYVFFREIDARDWPRGSLGVRLTPEASIATDKTVFPAACPAVLETAGLIRLVFDQDTGGAIKGPRRADIYFGAGDAAGEIAGRLVTHGRLTYLLLKDTH
jgi:membrane-bound lytic murein transglycosylase A